jgi:hypothetical protein
LGVFESAAVFRALVWDETNYDTGLPYQFFAQADQSKVYLYVLLDRSKPLLVDKDKDALHICDDVNTDSTQVAFKRLSPLAPNGNSVYGKDFEAEPKPIGVTCASDGLSGSATPLCPGSDMTRVIRHSMPTEEPVIYAIPGSSQLCTGDGWTLSATLPSEGWVCLAARAEDRVGNAGISPPLRLCYDKTPGDGVSPCTGQPPSCSDGCTPPPLAPPAIIKIPE